MKATSLQLLVSSVLLLAPAAVTAAPLDEPGFQKLMKELGDIAKRSKGNQEEKNAAQMAKDATRLADIYQQTVPFWKARKVEDAVKWSAESEAAGRAAAAAAKAGNWDKVKSDFGGAMKNCKNCHEAHREKLDDGSYRIK